MAIKIPNWLKSKPKVQEETFAKIDGDLGGITGGRKSDTTTGTLYGMLRNEMGLVPADFDLEAIAICEHLALHNGDVSYAIDNIRQLGNTPYTITFDDKVSEEQSVKMIYFLQESMKKIYNGGMPSLVADLLVQAGITGAVSLETIPHNNLKSVAQVVLVQPISIRFKYNKTTYKYDPYQQPKSVVGFFGGISELIKLNPNTYSYYALTRVNDNPTAIPPIMSAFDTIELEKDMICNMKNIIKKIGVFGFLEVLVAAPVRKQGETDAAYKLRTETRLRELMPEIEKGFASGMTIGYKNAVEFKVSGNTTNAEGFKEIMELVTQMKMAGMKQDPLMLGRNFNVAETMARVILVKLISEIGSYQRLVANVLEDVFRLMLAMNNMPTAKVLVEFEPPIFSDKLKDEQAYEKRIDNRKKLRDMGVIGQEGMANELGYTKAAHKKDHDYSVKRAEDKTDAPNPEEPVVDKDQAEDPTGTGSNPENYSRKTADFRYHSDCRHTSFAFVSENKQAEKVTLEYLAALNLHYDGSMDRVAAAVVQYFEEMGVGTKSEFRDMLVGLTLSNWDAEYAPGAGEIVNEYVPKMYREFTKNDSQTVRDAYLLLGAQVLSYHTASDRLYTEQFITDKDTLIRLRKFADESYASDVSNLTVDLAAMLKAERWKLGRVINTTASQMDNSTALIRLAAEDVEKYKLVSIADIRRCNYCATMDGKEFIVSRAMEHLQRMVSGNPADVASTVPFVTELFKGKPGEVEVAAMTGEQLQAAGLMGFTSHPNCRCKLVRVKSTTHD